MYGPLLRLNKKTSLNIINESCHVMPMFRFIITSYSNSLLVFFTFFLSASGCQCDSWFVWSSSLRETRLAYFIHSSIKNVKNTFCVVYMCLFVCEVRFGSIYRDVSAPSSDGLFEM